jgi:aldehyde:ferredoxin oxidoreductase
MDLRERGILPDAELDGHAVEFGNGKAVLASPDAVAFRRGLGDVLAEGSVRASKKLGGAEHLAAVRGQELAMHDPRQRTEYGKQVRVSYATSPTGGDHMNSNLPSRSAKNTVGMCFFLRYDDPKLADIMNAVTGWGLDAAGVTDIGELSLTLARLFNNREGFGAADDVLPEQAMKPHVSGVLSRVRLDADDVAAQVRAYYRSRGWSDDGVPTPETLAKHGLSEYARA